MKKELIGILICTLLISVAIAPSINGLTIQKNEINDVNEQAKTLNLQDTDSLEKIIDDLITRFHDAETQEEKIAILEELVMILDNHGLLPEDVALEEAKELIVSSYLETLSSDSLQSSRLSDVARDNPVVVSKSITDIEKSTLRNVGGLVDNVKIKWFGTLFLIDLLLALLNFPVYYTQCEMKNNNDVSFYYEAYITLSTGDGRILDTSFLAPPFQHKPDQHHTWLYFTRRDWQYYEYMWGHFDIILDYHILDDGSSVKMLFHGFIFNIGTIIFNPEGEVINGSDGQNIQSNPINQKSTNPLFLQML